MKFYNHECPDAKEKHSVMYDSTCAVDSQKTVVPPHIIWPAFLLGSASQGAKWFKI